MYKKLLSAATAANSAPSAAPGNAAATGFWLKAKGGGSIHPASSVAIIAVRSTAGSGTMNVLVKLWGYCEKNSAWEPLGGDPSDALRGVINDGNYIGEDGANTIRHQEVITHLDQLDGIYAEIVDINGTSTAVDVILRGKGS
jgi:hypothetical protein